MNPRQKTWLMLVSRSIMFLGFQALFALAFRIGGSADAWKVSEAWWTIAVILTNLVCLVLLVRFYRQEGLNFWGVFRIQRFRYGQCVWGNH